MLEFLKEITVLAKPGATAEDWLKISAYVTDMIQTLEELRDYAEKLSK